MSSRSLTTTNLNSGFNSSRSNLSASVSTTEGVVRSDHAGSGYVESGPTESKYGAPSADNGLHMRQPYLGILLLLILLLAAGLRFYDLGAESYSYDEGIMIEATSSGWDTVVANISRGRPPLIVLLGFGWTTLFGESEFAVRLLPALMGILCVGLLFRIGQTLKNDTVGLVAAFIMAISAFHLFHSQDYRYYSLLTLMTLASFTFYLKCFYHTLDAEYTPARPAPDGAISANPASENPGSREAHSEVPHWTYIALYILFSAAVYYTHYQGVFLLVAQGLFFLLMWFRARNPLRWRWLLSQIVLGLLLVPSILDVLLDMVAGSEEGDFQGTVGALGNLGPLSDPPLWLPFHTLFIKFYFLSIGNLFNWPYLLAAVALLGVGLVVANRYRMNIDQKSGQSAASRPSLSGLVSTNALSMLAPPRLLILVGLWALCPIFIPYILSKVVSPMYLPRYTIGALPAACLLLALLLVALRRLLPLWASLGALAILALPGITTYYSADFKGQWRIAAQHLQEQSRLAEHPLEDETIVFISVNNETADRIQLLFGRYLGADTSTAGPGHSGVQAADAQAAGACAISAGLAGTDELGSQLRDCFSAKSRVWVVTRNAKEGPQQQIEASVLATIPPGWQMVDERQFSGVVLRLYEAETALKIEQK